MNEDNISLDEFLSIIIAFINNSSKIDDHLKFSIEEFIKSVGPNVKVKQFCNLLFKFKKTAPTILRDVKKLSSKSKNVDLSSQWIKY